MLLGEAFATAIRDLTAAHVGSPRMNSEVLLMFTLNVDRAYLYAHPERPLSPEELARYQQAITERARGVPAQYITGHQEFWGLDFIVTPAVLIPRPETEHLIETVLPLALPLSSPQIVDVGTGSGCIAIVLARELPHARLYATDISPAALEIARANAARHQLEQRIDFREANLLQGFPQASFDFVVSNPPYVGDSEEDQVQLEVRKFEPRNAVFAGHTGTEVIARLVPQATETLKPEGWLIMEISGTIHRQVVGLLDSWRNVQTILDLQRIPRIVVAQKAQR